jgi:hypothetical protein
MYTGPNITTDGLVLSLDAANTKSYVSGSNVWRDVSGNNYSGSLSNNPTFSTDYSGILIMNGTNNFVTLTLPTFSLTYSISFWFRPISFPIGANNEIQLFSSPGDVASLSFYSFVSNIYTLGSWNGSGYRQANTKIGIGNWYHLVMVNNVNTTFFINGMVDNTLASTATLNSGQANIGCINGNARFFNGNISMVSFYNRGLSSIEVAQIYNSQKSRFNL